MTGHELLAKLQALTPEQLQRPVWVKEAVTYSHLPVTGTVNPAIITFRIGRGKAAATNELAIIRIETYRA